jgi:hypothetical protein
MQEQIAEAIELLDTYIKEDRKALVVNALALLKTLVEPEEAPEEAKED